MSLPVAYNEMDIEMGLRLMALNGGSPTKAHRQMVSAGRPVPISTLKDWRENAHSVRYAETLSELRAEIGETVASEATEIAGLATQVEKELITNLQNQLHDLEARELANAALKMAQAKEINVRTARVLRDQPTSITEVRDPNDIIAELTHLGLVANSTETTAEET